MPPILMLGFSIEPRCRADGKKEEDSKYLHISLIQIRQQEVFFYMPRVTLMRPQFETGLTYLIITVFMMLYRRVNFSKRLEI